MGTYDQEIGTIGKQIELGETPSPDDVLWLCRNLRATLAECKRWEEACVSLHANAGREVRTAVAIARELFEDLSPSMVSQVRGEWLARSPWLVRPTEVNHAK